MKRIFGRGRYANVTATLALIMAMGGTSYAAVKLAPNSVGTIHLKSSAVTTAKVKDGSLKAADFKAGTLQPGKDGAPGPKGDSGAPGAVGPPGAKGDKGDKGAPCPASDPACKGPKGDNGTNGTDGIDGITPAGFSAVTTSPLAYSTSNITVQTLSLQPGKYVVDGRVGAHNNAATADSTVVCSLVSGATTIDGMGGPQGLDVTSAIDTQVSLHGVLVLAAAGSVDLKCQILDPVAGTYTPRSITAIQVGTLNGA